MVKTSLTEGTDSAVPVADRLMASSSIQTKRNPFLTVAIPHYKHRRYLEIVLDSLTAQTYKDFEILISDDCSPDDSSAVIPSVLQKTNRTFRYYAQKVNLGYDRNLRFVCAPHAGAMCFFWVMTML